MILCVDTNPFNYLFLSFLISHFVVTNKIAKAQAEGRIWWSFEFFPPRTAQGLTNLCKCLVCPTISLAWHDNWLSFCFSIYNILRWSNWTNGRSRAWICRHYLECRWKNIGFDSSIGQDSAHLFWIGNMHASHLYKHASRKGRYCLEGGKAIWLSKYLGPQRWSTFWSKWMGATVSIWQLPGRLG